METILLIAFICINVLEIILSIYKFMKIHTDQLLYFHSDYWENLAGFERTNNGIIMEWNEEIGIWL